MTIDHLVRVHMCILSTCKPKRMNQTHLSALAALILFSTTALSQSFTLSTDLLGDAFNLSLIHI